jgi:hypothetical protein
VVRNPKRSLLEGGPFLGSPLVAFGIYTLGIGVFHGVVYSGVHVFRIVRFLANKFVMCNMHALTRKPLSIRQAGKARIRGSPCAMTVQKNLDLISLSD